MSNIKISKYIIAFFAFLITMIFAGESIVLTLYNKIKYEVTYISISSEQFDYDYLQVLKTSEKYDLICFINMDDVTSMLSSKFTIYCEYEDTNKIERFLGTDQNKLKSILYPNQTIEYKSNEDFLSEYSSGTLYISVIGDNNEIGRFINEVGQMYPNKSTNLGKSSNIYRNILYIFSALVIAVLFMLTYLESCFKKKEKFLCVSLGERLSLIILKSCLIDTTAYGIIFWGEYLVISRYTALTDNFEFLLCTFTILVLSGVAAHSTLMNFNYKAIACSNIFSRKVLNLNYLLKTAATVTTIVFICYSISFVTATQKYIKAERFFDSRQNYYICNFTYPVEDTDNMNTLEKINADRLRSKKTNEGFYRDCAKIGKPVILSMQSLSTSSEKDNYKPGECYIYANANAKDYLSNAIKEYNFGAMKSDICILYPEFFDETKKQAALERILQDIKTIEGSSFEFTYETATLTKNIDILYTTGSPSGYDVFDFAENPCIVYNSVSPEILNTPLEETARSNVTVMYEFSDASNASKIAEKYGAGISEITNVYDCFNYYYNIYITALVVFLLFILIMLVFQLSITKTILRLEYTVDAIELSVKKILGYTILQKNLYIFIITLVSAILGVAISAVVCITILKMSIITVVSVSAFIFIAEAITYVYIIRKIEKTSMVKILKGGAL